jgi:hypothetical protein
MGQDIFQSKNLIISIFHILSLAVLNEVGITIQYPTI